MQLQIHFFGKKGNKDLEFDGFYKFMKNLQTEVLELEFHEFSKGHEKISEVDFAKILLRYTYLDTDEYDNFLDRLLDREAKEKGVSFEEFRQFCQFLNNLEDFSVAMRMFTLANRSISKGENRWRLMTREHWWQFFVLNFSRGVWEGCQNLHRSSTKRASDRYCFCHIWWRWRWTLKLQRIHRYYEGK